MELARKKKILKIFRAGNDPARKLSKAILDAYSYEVDERRLEAIEADQNILEAYANSLTPRCKAEIENHLGYMFLGTKEFIEAVGCVERIRKARGLENVQYGRASVLEAFIEADQDNYTKAKLILQAGAKDYTWISIAP